MLEALAYLADATILGTYWILAQRGFALPYHLANGIATLALIAFEVQQKAWPIVALSGAYFIIAWKGIINASSSSRGKE